MNQSKGGTIDVRETQSARPVSGSPSGSSPRKMNPKRTLRLGICYERGLDDD